MIDAKMTAKVRQTADRYRAKAEPVEWPDNVASFCWLCCRTFPNGRAWDDHVTDCIAVASEPERRP